jgi:integral membrane protein
MNLTFSNTALGRFRLVAISEGISYILLLFIAMPLKYMAGWAEGVTYVGWVHGLLFMLYILALISVKFTLNWGFEKTIIAFLASLIPFGTFILDKSLQKEEKLIKDEKLVS